MFSVMHIAFAIVILLYFQKKRECNTYHHFEECEINKGMHKVKMIVKRLHVKGKRLYYQWFSSTGFSFERN